MGCQQKTKARGCSIGVQLPGPSLRSAQCGGFAEPLCLAAPVLSSAVGEGGLGLERESTYRLYHCRGCHAQVQICAACDYGNLYCAAECAELARRASVRRAGARYQRTLRGSRCHAERQRRYRVRCAEEVTHQGFSSTAAARKVAVDSGITREPLDVDAHSPASRRSITHVPGRCAFCGTVLPSFARFHPWHGSG